MGCVVLSHRGDSLPQSSLIGIPLGARVAPNYEVSLTESILQLDQRSCSARRRLPLWYESLAPLSYFRILFVEPGALRVPGALGPLRAQAEPSCQDPDMCEAHPGHDLKAMGPHQASGAARISV